jgi:hypothetical protein
MECILHSGLGGCTEHGVAALVISTSGKNWRNCLRGRRDKVVGPLDLYNYFQSSQHNKPCYCTVNSVDVHTNARLFYLTLVRTIHVSHSSTHWSVRTICKPFMIEQLITKPLREEYSTLYQGENIRITSPYLLQRPEIRCRL